jgi:hypothetical protein
MRTFPNECVKQQNCNRRNERNLPFEVFGPTGGVEKQAENELGNKKIQDKRNKNKELFH